MKNARISQLIILLALSSLLLSAVSAARVSARPAVGQQTPPTAYTSVFITAPDGTNHTDDLSASLIGKTITFGVNVSNSPAIVGFEVQLTYNYTVLGSPTLDASMSPLGTGTNVISQYDCIDNVPQSKCPATVGDNPTTTGDIVFNQVFLGNFTTEPLTKATLFKVIFPVQSRGLGQVHIEEVILIGAHYISGQPTQYTIPLLPFGDGYYNNIACPRTSTTPCRPPQVTISYSPTTPSPGTVLTFNATTLVKNTGVKIVNYTWSFGDGNGQSQLSNFTATIQHQYSSIARTTSACINRGNCTVTLSTLEDDGIMWTTTTVVPISHLRILVTISAPGADPQYMVTANTPVHVNATIRNLSTLAEQGTANITLEGKSPALKVAKFSLPPGGIGQVISTTWNTTGLTPRVYILVVNIGNLSSVNKVKTTDHPEGIFLYGDLNATLSDYSSPISVQIVAPLVTGSFSLTLLQTTGLGVIVFLAVGAALARFRKRPSFESEPL